MLTKSSDVLNKNTWGVTETKKNQQLKALTSNKSRKSQQPKALISVRAKKFISSQLFITNFYFKGTQQFTGRFPNHDWLCHPWPRFLHDPLNKRWPRVTKPIMVGKTPCKLLCAFEVKVSNK